MAITARMQALWRTLTGHDSRESVAVPVGLVEQGPHQMAVETVEFAPNDPIFAYLQGAGTVVEVDKLNLDSAAAQTLKEAGVKIAIPLMSQGELVGLLNLGHRLGEQEYSIDDRRLLRDLVSQAGPAVRVAQPISQQVGLGVTFALVGALTLAIGAVFFVGGRVSARTPGAV